MKIYLLKNTQTGHYLTKDAGLTNIPTEALRWKQSDIPEDFLEIPLMPEPDFIEELQESGFWDDAKISAENFAVRYLFGKHARHDFEVFEYNFYEPPKEKK
jgi:hypothetical protein